MQRHELLARSFLKAKGRRVTEFFGLGEPDFRELIILAHHCEKELGLSMTALSPDPASGVRLELSGGKRGAAYQVRVSPLGEVSLSSTGAQPRQLFRNGTFSHLVMGQLFRAIKTEEKQKPWLT
jgi:hypothetical protein